MGKENKLAMHDDKFWFFFKGKLYAVGGSDGTHALSTTEIYDPETKTWTPGPNMTTPRANVGVAVIGGRLYAVGGFSGKKPISDLSRRNAISTVFCICIIILFAFSRRQSIPEQH